MTCPICDQKPMNCDCTETERRQFSEIEDLEAEIARLRLTDAERYAVLEAAGCYVAECDELQAAGVVVDAKRLAVRDTLRGLLNRMTL